MGYLRILPIIVKFAFINLAFGQSDFRYAQPGEYWIVMTDMVPVMRTPQSYPSQAEIFRNMVGIISQNTKVKVLQTKGWIDVWQKVETPSSDGTIIIGWVLSSVVKSARKVSQTQSRTSPSKWGVIRYTHTVTNVRADRNTSSRVVTQLTPNQVVKADFLENNWWAVFRLDEKTRSESNAIGYAHSSLLHPEPKLESNGSGTGTSTPKRELLPYEVVKKEDISYRGTSRMIFRVLLDVATIPEEREIKEVAHSLWEQGSKSWNEFTVFLYLAGMNTNGTAYGVANFTPSGLKDFRVQEYSLLGTKWDKK